MFDSSELPRIFGLPLGIDFPEQVIEGVLSRLSNVDPATLARTEIYVNTRRMQRRMRDLFDAGPARLLPRIRLITDLAHDPVAADIPPAVSSLRRRLEMTTLVSQLLHSQPDLASRASLFDLADSLSALMDEMQGEGVAPDVLETLNVADQSGYWERALTFVRLAQRYFGDSTEPPDAEARQRAVIERLVARWDETPPSHPIIVAGSTGSRGATALFMRAVSKLPQGAVILPGFDFDMPAQVWNRLDQALAAEDHPQYRFARIMQDLGLTPDTIKNWSAVKAPNPERNRLISLSLRPAPVTDQWLTEGRKLRNLENATQGVTLLEAPSPRIEALAIALRLKKAVDEGTTAALITPDRMLTRQVTAALDRWAIVPDDSAGLPLQLSAPGRFLRHVASLFGQVLTAEALLTLLKHPLTHSSGKDRGQHLLMTRELELFVRRYGLPFPRKDDLLRWAAKRETDDGRLDWAEWLGDLLEDCVDVSDGPLADHCARHIELAERLAAGSDADGSGELWLKEAGRTARQSIESLSQNAQYGGTLSPADYSDLFGAILAKSEVRRSELGHSNIRIWGTLEARVQGADLVILGSMNDGSWPESPKPDPWLNRALRDQAGLLLPERRIGLSAHDYQQAVAGSEVWITRSARSDDAETIPSRWVNRLTNLMGGLNEAGGPQALEKMRETGAYWVGLAQCVSTPDETDIVDPAPRPSPAPPTGHRPDSLSITRIKTLIRDPYAVYAEKVLNLRKLNPLTASADAPLRGIAMHRIFERFITERKSESRDQAYARLSQIARDVFEEEAPWPTVRAMWQARLERVAPWFLETEDQRMQMGAPVLIEKMGKIKLTGLEFTLTARADRMDSTAEGAILIYDYKTGAPPSRKQERVFDKQLLLEAAMVERGGFAPNISPTDVIGAYYIGLGSKPVQQATPIEDEPPAKVWAEFYDLITKWMQENRGYTSRRAMEQERFESDYDHLARFGEWDTTAHAETQVVS